jgi:uncharacterized protein YjgD (DUF1641 family)
VPSAVREATGEARLDRIEARQIELARRLEDMGGAFTRLTKITDELSARLPEGEREIDERLDALTSLFVELSQPRVLEDLRKGLALLRSMPELVATASNVIEDLVERADVPAETVRNVEDKAGLFRLLRATREPEVQRALALLLHGLRIVGTARAPSTGRAVEDARGAGELPA